MAVAVGDGHLAERELGSWRAPDTALDVAPEAAIPPPRAQVVIVDKPDAGRTALVVGRVSIARGSPDYYAATVAAAVLHGYSGRINQEIRVKRGLSYGAGATLSTRRMPGLFTASTLVDHTRAVEATDVTLAVIRSLVDTPATDEDLVSRKATVTGAFHRAIETIDGITGSLAEHALYDVPLAELAEYGRRVQAVDAAAVRGFAARGLVPDDFIVLVGDASKFAGEIARAYANVRVIPSAQLDLGSPALGG